MGAHRHQVNCCDPELYCSSIADLQSAFDSLLMSFCIWAVVLQATCWSAVYVSLFATSGFANHGTVYSCI